MEQSSDVFWLAFYKNYLNIYLKRDSRHMLKQGKPVSQIVQKYRQGGSYQYGGNKVIRSVQSLDMF